ncbi:unnamed protein product, partial [Adineta steineri]
ALNADIIMTDDADLALAIHETGTRNSTMFTITPSLPNENTLSLEFETMSTHPLSIEGLDIFCNEALEIILGTSADSATPPLTPKRSRRDLSPMKTRSKSRRT